jgi:BlaI family transcriptional regulator, penicillinase repressor
LSDEFQATNMSREALSVTDAELAILEVLWSEGVATISELTAAIYGKRTTSRYATVQKLLERLEAKRCVARDRSSFAHRFTAAIERDELISHRLQEVAEKLCEGSLTPLLVHLVGKTRLSPQQRTTLLKMIDEAEARRGGTK